MNFVKLNDVVNYRKQFIEIDDDTKYKRCRVQLHRRGVKLRDEIYGADIKTKKQRLCKANDFIVAEMDAKFGGYGIIPNDLEGAIVSSHYYLCEMKPAKLLPMFLEVIIDSGELQKQIKAVGSTNYSRVSAKEVLEYEIPCPSIQLQKKIVKYYFGNKTCVTELKQELTHQQTLLKKLRQQILQEAIQGQLTADWRAEHPHVEPAAELLARIQAEKAQLIKDKKIKKQKPLPPIREDEKPFELPEGWVWCRVGSLLNKFSTGPFGSMLHKSDYVPNGIPLVNPANIINEAIVPSKKMMIDQETRKRLSKYVLQAGEFVIARRGDLSKCAIVTKKEEGWLCGTGSFFIKPSNFISRNFFIKVYRSLFFQRQLTDTSVGQTMANLNQKILNSSIFPLPPLQEQKAIITKVEKLFTICDQLETQITNNQTHAEQLMRAVLREAFTQAGEQDEKEAYLA